MPQRVALVPSEREMRKLRAIVESADTTTTRLRRRALAVLMIAHGATVTEVCEGLGCSDESVYRWVRRFGVHGVAGLYEQGGRGPKREYIPGEILDVVAEFALQGNRPTYAEISGRTGASRGTVQRIVQGDSDSSAVSFGLPKDPYLTEHLMRIVGVHLSAQVSAMAILVSRANAVPAEERAPEDAQMDRHQKTQPPKSLRSALQAYVARRPRRRRPVIPKQAFLSFVRRVNRLVTSVDDAYVVIRTPESVGDPQIARWLERHPRLHFVFGGESWFDMVDMWISMLAHKDVRRGRPRFRQDLREQIEKVMAQAAGDGTAFTWMLTRLTD